MGSYILDTLAQLRNLGDNQSLTRGKLSKKARKKYITMGVVNPLINLHSKLEPSYHHTKDCARVLIQEGKKLTSKYCNNRWCLVCNGIRTAKLIKGYVPTLITLEDKQFVTLTIPNVEGKRLEFTIRLMGSVLRKIQGRFLKAGTPIIGIRKLEVTYNPILNTYHPHYHLILSGEDVALRLVNAWLDAFSEAVSEAQHITPTGEGGVNELFKYFTKIFVKGRLYPEALDVIFTAMYGKRTFQPMGIKKDVSEDVEGIVSELCEDIPESELQLWVWEDTDWYAMGSGDPLTNYHPTPKIQALFNPP